MTSSKNDCNNNTILQAIKFCIIGASNTLVSLAVYYIFVIIDSDLYLLGNIAGFLVSVLNSYYWNNRYVFRDKNRNHIVAILKTYMMYGATTIICTLLLFVLVEYYGLSEFIAPLITTAVSLPLNFVLSKYWAFKTNNNSAQLKP